MKDYRSQFDALRFSPEEKQAMVDDLLAAAPETRRRVSHKKRLHVLIAAVIAAALCAACASGALQAAIQSLSFFLGNQPEQTQVLGEMAQPIGASVTDNGVTLTVDAVLGDKNGYAILYTLSRDDGGPLLQNVDPDANLYNIHFDDGLLTIDPDSDNFYISPVCDPLFTAFRPTDNAIHFFEEWIGPNMEQMNGLARVSLQNFRAGIVSMEIEKEEVAVEGNWTVDFQMTYQDSSIELPIGQTFHGGTNGALTGQIKELRLSPLSLYVTYSYQIDEEKIAEAYDPAMTVEPKEEWIKNEIDCQNVETAIFLNLKDGTREDTGFNGDRDSENKIETRSSAFSEIIPLDTIESITIGDLTIPVPQS